VEPPHAREIKRRKLRKKVTRDKDHQWELARQDAWLREILTDSSGSETEEKYAKFAELGRWIAEMTGIPQQATTTSRGECSGQEKPGS
jgi:predicted MarR family transcription regulator